MDTRIFSDGIDEAIDKIRNNTISEFVLCCRHMNTRTAYDIASAVQMNTSLTVFDIAGTKTGNNGIIAISAAFMNQNRMIRRLNFGGNRLDHNCVDSICDMLKFNQSIEDVTLNGNNIGAMGAQSISLELQNNTALVELHLSDNNIGDLGAISIANMLRRNESLRVLYLDGNRIGTEGGQALGESIAFTKNRSSLTLLSLSFNRIGWDGMNDIIIAVQDNKSLQTLYLDGNLINESEIASIVETSKLYERQKTSLLDDTAGNPAATTTGLYVITTLLQRNNTLLDLSLPTFWELNYEYHRYISEVIVEALDGWNDTLQQMHFQILGRVPDLQLKMESIVAMNQQGNRIAPKKVERHSHSIYNYLIHAWVIKRIEQNN